MPGGVGFGAERERSGLRLEVVDAVELAVVRTGAAEPGQAPYYLGMRIQIKRTFSGEYELPVLPIIEGLSKVKLDYCLGSSN